MAAAFVAERAKARIAGANSPTIAVSAGTTGNLALMLFGIGPMISSTGDVTSVTDTGGSTWSIPTGLTATTTITGFYWCYSFLTAAMGTLTVNISNGTSSNGMGYKIEEFSGLGTYDLSSTPVTNTTNTSGTTPSITPAGATELIVAGFVFQSSEASFTIGGSYVQAGTTINGGVCDCAVEYLLSAGSGAQTASGSWPTTRTFSAGIIAFKLPVISSIPVVNMAPPISY